MSEDVLVPGGRDVRGTLDGPEGADACVAACPPHPRQGGSRSDPRLRAVGDALAGAGVACLRFDYGPWDGGEGERADAERAVRWARERFDRVGLFGYSFGAGVALLAAGESEVGAVSALAPPARLDERDVAAALGRIGAPIQVVYGARDDTVDWAPVVERAREAGATVEEVSGDHFFVGQSERVAGAVAAFLAGHLRA